MNSKPIKIPGPDHPITITPTKGRVTVTVNGKRVADTNEALPVSRGSCAVSCTAHDHVAQGLKRSEYRLQSAPRFERVTRCLLMTQSGPIEPGRRVRLFVFDGCRSRISAINPRTPRPAGHPTAQPGCGNPAPRAPVSNG